MATDDEFNGKSFGINWKYLSTLLEAYEELLINQKILIRSISGCGGISPKEAYAIFCSDVYTFFCSVESQYVPYLEKIGKKADEYYNILSTAKLSKNLQEYEKLLKLSRDLCYWSTKEGPFKTLTENNNPDQAW